MKNSLPIFLSFLFLLVGCGDSPQEGALKAIDQALTLLSDGECDKAIEILEDVEAQEKNPVYVKTLASAYACRAGFNMVKFAEDDIAKINTSKLLQSISILTYSDVTSVDSSKYKDLQQALSVLGETSNYSQATRNSTFGKRHGEDMGVQVLVYSIVTLGKFLNWYGNVDSTTGKKGTGTGANSNTCYLNYSYALAVTVVGGLPVTNSCQSLNDGSPDLTGAKKITRMCEGITLIANIYDVLKTLDLTDSSTLSPLEVIASKLDAYRVPADAAGIGHLFDLKSPSACEVLLASASEMNNAELLYALLFESEHE